MTEPTDPAQDATPSRESSPASTPTNGASASSFESLLVDPRELSIPDNRVTSRLDPETEHMLVESIQTYGIRQPIKCRRVDGNLVVVDGMHRAVIALSLGMSEVPVVIEGGDERALLEENLVTNRLRGTTTARDMIGVIRELAEEHEVTPDDLQRVTGFSAGYARELLSIARADELVVALVDEGTLAVASAALIARLPTPEQQRYAANEAVERRMRVSTVQAMVDGLLEELQRPPEERRPPELVPLKLPACEGCGEPTEYTALRSLTLCRPCQGLAVVALAEVRSPVTAQPAPAAAPPIPPAPAFTE